ncbi:M38 (beta-aspartyl dipeptidase) family protein [Chondromyces apiculatus DSM 436]|uniref:M38 (Beta-aspartyl dipeptidase) family protein n=1 Tax=Chondromyces apiculatus DSM 436 TaxID=1192034 RepID=A0A017TEW1_9BACT|nr:M38 (beta-aspartyl dipeptidase) family protein [Chondromyces apiculatus DSM 436]
MTLGVLCGVLCGTAPAAPAAAQAETITVLRGARLVDGRGGAPVDPATIVLRGERVVAVGPMDALPSFAREKVIDLRGKTVMPGLVADHAHVGQTSGAEQGAAHYTRANVLRQLQQYQAYGVTTVTSLGVNVAEVFYPLRAEMRAGKVEGADLLGADHGVGMPDGAPPQAMLKAGAGQVDRPETPEKARQVVREQKARGTDLVKVWIDDFNHSMPGKMDPAIWRAVIEEAHQQGLRVAAHIYYLADAKALAEGGVDIIAHGVRDVPVDAAFIEVMKQRGTWYVPTLELDEATFLYAERPSWMAEPFFQHAVQPGLKAQLDDPAWRARKLAEPAVAAAKKSLEMNLRNLKALHDAGVHIGFGTDSGANPLRIPGFAEHRELRLMVQAGLSPVQAITIATREAAALLKLDDRGEIAPGKLGDLVVLDGDPTQDIGNADRIHAVWRRGRQVAGPVTSFTP